jgi:hypothetical protein
MVDTDLFLVLDYENGGVQLLRAVSALQRILVAMVVSESVIFLGVSLDANPIRRDTVNFFRNIFAELEDWFFISYVNLV